MQWNITKCKTLYKGMKNVEFWIVDYYKESDIPTPSDFSFLDKDIFDFRNEGVIQTKYFRTEEEALKFIDEIRR